MCIFFRAQFVYAFRINYKKRQKMTDNNDNNAFFKGEESDKMKFEVKRALLEDTQAPDCTQAYQEFLERNHLKPRYAKKKTLWISIMISAAAASIAILLILAPWKKETWNVIQTKEPNKELAKLGNVVFEASTERQYISLNMGDKIVDVSNQSSAKSAGVIVTRDNIIRVFDKQMDNHEDVTLSVPAGKTAKVILDDGTLVTLNAGSQLTFPHHFREGEQREVKLLGEAFFEVTHNESRPFIVNTEELQTKVLGTKFNVRCFPKESCQVTLVEGSVLVSHDDQMAYLNPDETVSLKNEKFLETSPADMDHALGWLSGEFYFDGQSLRDIMTEIGRWYNLNVVFAEKKYLQEKLHFSANRTAPVYEIIRQLQMIGNARIELKTKENVLLVH